MKKRKVNEKNDQTLATAHTQSRQSGAQTTSRLSALVRGRSTQFIANPCRWPQRQSPETRLHFCHFRGFYKWCLYSDTNDSPILGQQNKATHTHTHIHRHAAVCGSNKDGQYVVRVESARRNALTLFVDPIQLRL